MRKNKEKLMAEFDSLVAQGVSKKAAARQLNTHISNIYYWKKHHAQSPKVEFHHVKGPRPYKKETEQMVRIPVKALEILLRSLS